MLKNALEVKRHFCELYIVLETPNEFCWHGIWPDGFCGVWGLAAPIGLRRRASDRWLVAPMSFACPHAEEEA